ncbi:MAG: transposase [Bacteroidetes bacterium]|nr:transposase [Bacteroidota bacterium]
MIRIDSDPDLRCGTRRMTAQLQLMGYIINKKKVARLMKENGLTKKDESKQRKLMPVSNCYTFRAIGGAGNGHKASLDSTRQKECIYTYCVGYLYSRNFGLDSRLQHYIPRSEVDMGLRNIKSSGTCWNGRKRNSN